MPRIEAASVAEHHARRRADILAAAGRLFAEHGVVATDLKDVAAEVGLSRTALYRYFPDRDRLFLAWADELHGHVAAALEQVLTEHDDPHARLDAWIEYQLRHVAGDDHAVGRRVRDELGALPPALRERIEDAHRDLQDRLADTIAEIVGHRANLELTTRMVGAAVQGASTHVDEGARVDEVLPAVQRGVRALLAGASTSHH